MKTEPERGIVDALHAKSLTALGRRAAGRLCGRGWWCVSALRRPARMGRGSARRSSGARKDLINPQSWNATVHLLPIVGRRAAAGTRAAIYGTAGRAWSGGCCDSRAQRPNRDVSIGNGALFRQLLYVRSGCAQRRTSASCSQFVYCAELWS